MGALTLENLERRAWRMPVTLEAGHSSAAFADRRVIPNDVEFILSALEAAGSAKVERRASGDRVVYRTLAELQLFADGQGARPWVIYTRDVNPRGAGFVTRHRLPLGYGGVMHVRGPNGERLSIDCVVRRCRETVEGWFEGALSFNREQWALARGNFSMVEGAD